MSRLRTRVERLEAVRGKTEGFIVTKPGETAEAALRRHGVPADRWEGTTVVVIRSFADQGTDAEAEQSRDTELRE